MQELPLGIKEIIEQVLLAALSIPCLALALMVIILLALYIGRWRRERDTSSTKQGW